MQHAPSKTIIYVLTYGIDKKAKLLLSNINYAKVGFLNQLLCLGDPT